MASRGYIKRGDFAKEIDNGGGDRIASYILFNAIWVRKGGWGGIARRVRGQVEGPHREAMGIGGITTGPFVGDLNVFLAVKLRADWCFASLWIRVSSRRMGFRDSFCNK